MPQIFNDEKNRLVSLELTDDKYIDTMVLKFIKDGYGVRVKHPAVQPDKVLIEISV